MTLEEEGERATEMLAGRTVKLVRRNRPKEMRIEFTDGTRLYVDTPSDPVELSITGEFEDD